MLFQIKCLSTISNQKSFDIFRQIIDQDNYSPIPAATEEEYKHILNQFPFQDPELDKVSS